MMLKPCPFCGHATAPQMTSAAELNCEDEDDFNAWPHSDSFAVICNAARPGGAGGCGGMGGFMPTEAEAVTRWNARTTAPFRDALLRAAKACAARAFDQLDNSNSQKYWQEHADELHSLVDAMDGRALGPNVGAKLEPTAPTQN